MLLSRILKYKKVYLGMFVWALFLGCLPLNASAMPIASQTATHAQKAYQNDLETVSKFLEEEAVRERLSKLGLSAEQIREKLHTLDRQQIHSLAERIDSVKKAGGSGLIIAVLAILLVFIGWLYFTNRRVTLQKTYE